MTFFDFESYFQRLLAADDFGQRESIREEFHAYLNSLPEPEQRELRGAYEEYVRQRNQKDLAALEVLKEILGERKAA
jgi:histidinol-phosphate/aromatic aminotransferase/cobyric acid decarboxylase-like protein